MILNIVGLYLASCIMVFFVLCSNFGYKQWWLTLLISLAYPILLFKK